MYLLIGIIVTHTRIETESVHDHCCVSHMIPSCVNSIVILLRSDLSRALIRSTLD